MGINRPLNYSFAPVTGTWVYLNVGQCNAVWANLPGAACSEDGSTSSCHSYTQYRNFRTFAHTCCRRVWKIPWVFGGED